MDYTSICFDFKSACYENYRVKFCTLTLLLFLGGFYETLLTEMDIGHFHQIKRIHYESIQTEATREIFQTVKNPH